MPIRGARRWLLAYSLFVGREAQLKLKGGRHDIAPKLGFFGTRFLGVVNFRRGLAPLD